MTKKRYKRLVSSIDYYYCIDTNDDKGLTEEDMLNLLNKQDERVKELEQELQNLQTFKKILEFVEKDMEERADWQAYCEKEFEGL